MPLALTRTALAAALGIVSGGWLSAASAQSRMTLLPPLYSYPCEIGVRCTYTVEGDPHTYEDEGFPMWQAMIRAGRAGVPTVAIVNANDGPGSSIDSRYSVGLDSLFGASVRTIGYVNTEYGARSEAAIQADIDAWQRLYGNRITGIFFDEVASSVAYAGYYNTLCAYAQQKGLTLNVLNPGTVPEEGWSTTCSVVVTFENPYNGIPGRPGTSWAEHTLPERLRTLGASRLGAIVHTAPASALPSIMSKAAEQGYGYLYITDDAETGFPANPYNYQPSYWTQEVSLVASTTTHIGEERPSSGITLSEPRLGSSSGITEITLSLAKAESVTMEVVDVLGRKVAVLLSGSLEAGDHVVQLRALPAGVFFVRAMTPHTHVVRTIRNMTR